MIGALAACTLWAGGVVAGLPPAEHFEVSSGIGVTSGISLVGARGDTFVARSPAMLSFEVGFIHPAVPWLELAPTVMLEVEGRVGVGVDPRFRMMLQRKRFRPYVVVGVPVFFAPYTLAGIRAGGGLGLRLHKHFSIAIEAAATVFVLGDDLIRGTVLAKLDTTLSAKVHF
jgi:hypothetical protein